MRSIGLHLRLNHSLRNAAQRAIALQLPIFQCFFIEQHSRELITVDNQLVQEFNRLRDEHFDMVFVHASYFINLASLKYDAVRLFKRELHLAKRLSCSHIILHPGSAVGAQDKAEGIDELARSLNNIMRSEQEVTIVLENTTHGNLSVGSDITDFKLLLAKLDYPERISFCIDTAHAYSYGYDLGETASRNEFIALIDDSIGIQNISVIHLNDTNQHCGSRIDKHALIGEGVIGEDALKQFVLDERLNHIPIILELPVLPEDQEDAMLHKIRTWHS